MPEKTAARSSPVMKAAVEHVFDRSINQEIRVRGMESLRAPTEDAAFSSVCECIDESLRSKP